MNRFLNASSQNCSDDGGIYRRGRRIGHLGGTFRQQSLIYLTQWESSWGLFMWSGILPSWNNLREKLVATEGWPPWARSVKVAHELEIRLGRSGGFAKRLEKLDGNLKEDAGIIAREVDRLESILRERY